MPAVRANFDEVQTGFTVLPDGDYRMKVEKVEYDETGKNPFHTIQLSVDDVDQQDFQNQKLWHRIYMNKKDGTINPMSLGTIKSYAQAILGDEDANGDEINTDDFLDGYVIASVTVRDYAKKDARGEETGEMGQSNDVKRISPSA
jgi:hypothetical protein